MQQLPERQWVRFIHHLHMLKTLISNNKKHQTNGRQGSSSFTTKGLSVCVTLAAPVPLLLFKLPHHKHTVLFCVMICLMSQKLPPNFLCRWNSSTHDPAYNQPLLSISTCICGMLNWIYALVMRMILEMLVRNPCMSHLDAQGNQNLMLESVSTKYSWVK